MIKKVCPMKKKQHRRSDCPINFALETFGDMWSLLIIQDIVYFGKKTYGEFLASDKGMIVYQGSLPATGSKLSLLASAA